MNDIEASMDRLIDAMVRLMVNNYLRKNAPNVLEHAGAEWDASVTKLPNQHNTTLPAPVVLIRPRDGGAHAH